MLLYKTYNNIFRLSNYMEKSTQTSQNPQKYYVNENNKTMVSISLNEYMKYKSQELKIIELTRENRKNRTAISELCELYEMSVNNLADYMDGIRY